MYIMRTRIKELTVNGLKTRSGMEIDMSFVKTETNTGHVGQLNCYWQ